MADLIRETRGIVIRSTVFTVLGALTEGLGLILLLPLVNVVSKAGFGNGVVDRIAARFLTFLPVVLFMTDIEEQYATSLSDNSLDLYREASILPLIE